MLIVLGILTAGNVYSQTTFGPQQVIIQSETNGASSVYAADLDGDGDTDVLSTSVSNDRIAWYENDGAGNIGAQQVISTSVNGANSVCAADLDGDGDADVLSASLYDDKIAWYENDGAGNFGAKQIITTAADGATSVYAADLDGDGDIDVLSASSNDDKIAWYENNGVGNFGAQQIISTSTDYATSVYAADLDGDGDIDVLSASRNDDKIAWYENDGTGNFGAQQIITISTDSAASVYAADLDGDGDLDVLSASSDDDKIAWYENNGVGNFSLQQIVSTATYNATSVYAADLDGDGDTDVLSASSMSKIAWYENDGTGNFSVQQVISIFTAGARYVYAADLDGDGDIDVLSASISDDKIAWYGNDGMGNFGEQQIITSAASNAWSVYAADLDSDGDADVLSASWFDDKIAWYENDGIGNFGVQQIISTAADGARYVYAADLDGDGDMDVLSASEHDDKISLYANDGAGNFGEQQIISTDVNGPESVYAADIDGDGDVDVLSASALDDKIAWYENNGLGNFGEQQIITTSADKPRSVYATDLDGDGDIDVLSASEIDDKIAWYENDGIGNFGEQQIISTAADGARSVYAADLNGDGDVDVLSASKFDNKIAWHENNGTGNFDIQQIISTTAISTNSVYAADLDRDGDVDVLSTLASGNKIAWYENDGAGNFGVQQIITTAVNAPTSVYAADIDGDGDMDILSASESDDKIAWYENLLAFSIQATVNNLPCLEAENGSVLLQASGGVVFLLPPYTYTWVSYTGTSGSGTATEEVFTISGLSAGTYNITLANAAGDSAEAVVTLSTLEGSVFEITDITTVNSSNNSPNGIIQITVDAGTPPFTVSWTGEDSGSYNSNNSTFIIYNLFAGEYNLFITDAEGLTLGHTVTLLDETTPQYTCKTPMDIVILNDSSGSVDAEEYSESKQFFVDFINALNIGTLDTQSRAAIVEWSSSTEQQIRIPMTGNLADLQNYTVQSRAFSGGTNPNEALTFGHNYLDSLARPQAVKVLILSTDGTYGQVSGSLVALAETYKAQGYIVVTVAFDDAYSNPDTRNLLTQTASLPMLAPGAPAYSMLTPILAYNIVNLYVCPSNPGSSNTYYFYRDGAMDITGYTANGSCPNPSGITVQYTITAQQQLSLPAGTPITFYYNNPALFSSTPILTTYIPCAIPAGSSEVMSTYLPVTDAANIWAVLNDNGIQPPPIVLPVTEIAEHVYVNNIDNIAVCAEPLPTLSALQYTTTPQPVCGNTVIYTVDVCNISDFNATGVVITHQPPDNFELLGQNVNYNNCSSSSTSGVGYDIPAGCCVSVTYEYDATNAVNGFYNNTDVALSGIDGQIYLSFNGAVSSAEDVTIDGTVNCPSDIVLFEKNVNLTEVCEESFVTYTFTIDNQTGATLHNLSFTDVLPDGVIWAAEPYMVSGLSIGQTGITGLTYAAFTIAEIPPFSAGTFALDAYIENWQSSGILNNTAMLGNLPAFVNGSGVQLTATTPTVTVNTLPQIAVYPELYILEGQTAVLNAATPPDALITWTTDGDGTILQPNQPLTIYYPGPNDMELGQVNFTVSAQSAFENCGQSAATLLLHIISFSEPLPVSLTTFTGTVQPHDNLLQWTTAAEVNNAYFTLQFSPDGNEFIPLAQITGAGTTSTTKSYHHTHENPFPLTYYRLLQTDYNGTTRQAGEVITLSRNQTTVGFTLTHILPNPTRNTATLTYTSTQTQLITLYFYDLTGRLLYKEDLHPTIGTNNYVLDMLHYPQGLYVVTLNNGFEVVSGKVVKE